MAQEALSETLKFLRRICSEELQSRYGTSLFALCCRHELFELCGDFTGGGLRRIYDVHMRGRDALEERLQQGTCFLSRLQAACFQRLAISMAAHSGVGAYNNYLSIARCCACGLSPRFDYSNHWDVGCGG